MKKQRSGFFLVEVMLYLFISSLMIMLLMGYAGSTARQLRHWALRAQRIAQAESALQLLVRDINAAPARASAWHEKGPNTLGWQVGKDKTTWRIDNNYLKRSSGTKGRSYKAAHPIKKGSFGIQTKKTNDTYVKLAWFTACLELGDSTEHTVSVSAVPRNRKL